MNHDIEYLKEYLVRYDIKPSNIRLKVLDLLLSKHNHPTAFEIYEELLEDLPTLSKTSIYNTLDKFSEMGLVNSVSLNDKEAHFDIVTRKHGHFRCEKCNKIYDFDLVNTDYKDLQDFIIKDEDIHLYGLCKNCR